MKPLNIIRPCSICVLALVLGGCTTTTGVVPIGDGIFMLAKQEHMAWSGGKVKAELYAEAAAHCKTLGKEVSPVGDTSQDATMSSYASAEIKFRCKP